MQTVYDDAGFPMGAYTNIYATNDQIVEVIADPRVQGVSVTGSERAGAAVAEIAGRNLKKVVLELGGSDPFVLLSTDDLDGVVESAVTARLENAGEACNAAKRFVVASDLYEPFVSKLTEALTAIEPGDPSLPDSAMRDLFPRRQPPTGLKTSCAGRWQGVPLSLAGHAMATSSRPASSRGSPRTTAYTVRSCSGR